MPVGYAPHSTRIMVAGLKPRSAALPLRARAARALLRERISSVSSRALPPPGRLWRSTARLEALRAALVALVAHYVRTIMIAHWLATRPQHNVAPNTSGLQHTIDIAPRNMMIAQVADLMLLRRRARPPVFSSCPSQAVSGRELRSWQPTFEHS